MSKEKNFLHFVHDFSLLWTDFLLRGTRYFEVDYVHIYEPNRKAQFSFLTKSGLDKAALIGKELIFDNKDWQLIFDNTEKGFGRINFENIRESIAKNDDMVELNNIIGILKDEIINLANVYFLCEEPTLKYLEDRREERGVVDILNYIGQFKLRAHKVMSLLEELFELVTEKVCERVGADYNDCVFLLVSELQEAMLQGGIDKYKDKIKIRKAGYVYKKEDGVWQVLVGDKFLKHKNEFWELESGELIEGRVAYKEQDKVVGRVKLHVSSSKTQKFAKDEIVVAGMTNPQLVPYLKSVKGVITDEGGLVCHAAIISRELKIPCIVGAQTATRVLQDGDMVEMDMNSGIIRKIDK